ncbi:MAG: RND family transporter [Candidatus Binatia bacterium]
MLPKRLIERYLVFLLRRRAAISVVIAIGTLFFVWFTATRLTIFTNFFDLMPPHHPYIQLYTKYRSMFGTANTLVMVLEVKHGTIFDSVETIRKVNRITLDLLHNVPGVNGEQVLSITHPKLKTTLTSGSGIKVVPLIYPRLPRDKEDLEFLRQKIYTTEGVRGFFVSPDDTATLISAGFWEEYFDLNAMWQKVQEIVKREEADGTVKIYVTGPPVLYAYFNEALGVMGYVFLATGLAMVGLLWFYFRSLQGVIIPVFSGLMSAVWGLGFAGLCGLTLDPLVLVVFVLITARALSHSVQSMERYHEEYHATKDKTAAIMRSYVSLYSPAMVSIVADGLAILTIAVASIPLMQKLAFVASFWIISIFLSVVTLHPIILSYVRPPQEQLGGRRRVSDALYEGVSRALITIGTGSMRWAVVGVFAVVMGFGLYFAHQLKVGDTELGAALLYPDHPYNQAFRKMNEKFVGIASQLVIIAEGKKPGAVKDAATLNKIDLFARYMTQGAGANGALTATTLLKKIFRTFHEGDPKWEMLPTRNDYVGQLFFLLTAGTSRGEMDRFFSPDQANATITIFYNNYNNDIIHSAIARAKAYIAEHTRPEDSVRYLLAGGLMGILAASNEEVEWSYRVNVPLIFFVVFVLSFATYRSVVGALIVMIPSLVAQPLSEAVMYLMGIDFNVNSLPVAAVGIGIGIDYGYYVLSRIVEEYEITHDFDEANRRAIATTGKAIIFTGSTLVASVVFWLFFPLKFEANMAFVLMMLMIFHAIGALVFIPAMVSLLRPRFAVERAAQRVQLAAEVGARG